MLRYYPVIADVPKIHTENLTILGCLLEEEFKINNLVLLREKEPFLLPGFLH